MIPAKHQLSREITKFQETQNSLNKVLDNHKAQPSSQSHIPFFSLQFQIMVSRLFFRSSKLNPNCMISCWTSSASFTSPWVCFISSMPKDCNQVYSQAIVYLAILSEIWATSMRLYGYTMPTCSYNKIKKI